MYGHSDLSPISHHNREATSVESQASYQRFLDFKARLKSEMAKGRRNNLGAQTTDVSLLRPNTYSDESSETSDGNDNPTFEKALYDLQSTKKLEYKKYLRL
jgi:hypothetical protein